MLVNTSTKPRIRVDWSTIPNQSTHVLRAALVTTGRALTLYEEVHPEKKLTSPNVHARFLMKLKSMLPDEITPIIITDAGFHSSWFKTVHCLVWDYIGRIRGTKYYRLLNNRLWASISSLHKDATATPTFLGIIELCKNSGLITYLYRYESKKTGRKAKTKRGNIKQNAQSLKHAKGAKEPWLLVSSLNEGSQVAEKVIKIYKMRMQIEEGFRDLKSTKYGFGSEHVSTKYIYRLHVFFLIAMIACILAWIRGWLAENNNLQRQYQANSTKNRRVLSLFYLGYRIILREKELVKNTIIQGVMQNFPNFSEE